MAESRLIELSYYDPKAETRLTAYADTIVLDHNEKEGSSAPSVLAATPRSSGPLSDAIYGGSTIEATQNDATHRLQSKLRGYQRQLSHDGIYATATLMANDDEYSNEGSEDQEDSEETAGTGDGQQTLQPRKCYIFCPAGDRDRLFEELDHKTAAPLIPAFQDYVLDELEQRGSLRRLHVISLKEKMDAWVLELRPNDENVVQVLEDGLKSGQIAIPGAVPGPRTALSRWKTSPAISTPSASPWQTASGISFSPSLTRHPSRCRRRCWPSTTASSSGRAIPCMTPSSPWRRRSNASWNGTAPLSLLRNVAVARPKSALLQSVRCMACGPPSTRSGAGKSFGLVMSPSHVTRKWVREIGETLPDTYGMVVRSITDLNRLYQLYEQGDKSVFAVFSKEKARDGYMRYPAVTWNRRRKGFPARTVWSRCRWRSARMAQGTGRTLTSSFFPDGAQEKSQVPELRRCTVGTSQSRPADLVGQDRRVRLGLPAWRQGASRPHKKRIRNGPADDACGKPGWILPSQGSLPALSPEHVHQKENARPHRQFPRR